MSKGFKVVLEKNGVLTSFIIEPPLAVTYNQGEKTFPHAGANPLYVFTTYGMAKEWKDHFYDSVDGKLKIFECEYESDGRPTELKTARANWVILGVERSWIKDLMRRFE